MATPVPINFDWVKARKDCSIPDVFKTLERETTSDVAKINALYCGADSDRAQYLVSSSGDGEFAVIFSRNPVVSATATVDFVLTGEEIKASC